MPFLLALFVLFACSSTKPGLEKTPPTATPQDLAFASQAKTLDDYIHGKLSEDALRKAKEGCQKGDSSPFCYSYAHLDSLDREINRRTRVQPPPQVLHPKVIIPIAPVMAGGAIKNWSTLRKAKVDALLKGLNGQSPATLQTLKRRALAESTCPNHIAVAVAAVLEDGLPGDADAKELAVLYEKGGVCAKKTPSDHEAYLTRAGLFYFMAQDFPRAESALAQAAQSDGAYTGRALYWLYRTRKRRANQEGAKAAADQLTSKYPFAFHTLLVASDGNEDPGAVLLRQPPGAVTTKRSQKKPEVNHIIEQAELLKRLGFDESAAMMVSWALTTAPHMENDVKVYVASLGDAHTQVTLIPDLVNAVPALISRETMEMSFPRHLYPLFEKNSGGVDPYLLLSVARQESTFNPRAISPANAQGLLQLNPVTAKKMMNGATVNLLDPKINVTLGARYLSQMIHTNQGQIFLALAAYNAGQDKVALWRKMFPTDDSILFIDLISYRETRGYVAAVLRNYFWYRRLAEPSEYALKRIVNSGIGPVE